MKTFKPFFESKIAEEDKNIKATLKKLPARHSALVSGFKYNFQSGNTIQGDDLHVGYIDSKTIGLAGAWNFGREFVFLHEVAHKVWEKLVDEKLKKEWSALTKVLKSKESDEELFCMYYSQHYVETKLVKFDDKKLDNFIKDLPK